MAQKNEKLRLRSWYSNKYQLVLVQKKMLSLFCILAMSTVVVAVIFVKQFTESKSFEPYVIELEEKTGVLTVVENLSQSKLTADEAIKKSLIYTFLEVAEGYNYVTFNEDRRKLMLFSGANVYRQLYSKYSIRNKDSIVNLLQNRATLTIKIKSIIFNTPTIATVRFVVYNSLRGNRIYPAERHFITEIQFMFSDMKLNTEDRYVNPLGFQVVKYSIGEDINM
jgi:type IV secretion system protein VirB8